MPEITPFALAGFLERFSHCYDGVVRDVSIDFAAKRAVVNLLVRDREAKEEDGWVHLTLEVEGLTELSLSEGKSTCIVLSGGLQVGFFNGIIYLDFCPYTEVPVGVEDFRRSDFLIAGARCAWSVSCADR